MTKYLRREAALASPIYIKLIEACEERLTSAGVFSKTEVMVTTQLDALDDGFIRWDYIVEHIEREWNTNLDKLAAVFFKKNQRNGRADLRHGPAFPPERYPERYLAFGHGKKTAGYCIASETCNGHFMIAALKMRRNRSAGIAKKHDTVVAIGQRDNVPGLPPTILPPPPKAIGSE